MVQPGQFVILLSEGNDLESTKTGRLVLGNLSILIRTLNSNLEGELGARMMVDMYRWHYRIIETLD